MTNQANESHTAGSSSPQTRGRQFGVGALAAVAAASALLASSAVWWLGHAHHPEDQATPGAATQAPKPRYQCPMHPTVVQDHPGDCPICGMDLVKVEQGTPAGSEAAGAQAAKTKYQCPMHPAVVQDHPGDCPICGMDLVKVESGSAAPDAHHGSDSSLPGQATVEIDPARQQLIGLTTAAVSKGPIGGAMRTVGRVAVDETRVRRVNLKVSGFVERIYVDFVGKPVRKGDPLFTIYSPELLSAQEELLLAVRTRGALAKGGALAGDGDALVNGARRKLALWDIPESEIDRIAATGETTKSLTIHSPISGVVTKKDVVEGMKLDAGAMPYELIDLSRVWVLADVYESELRFIQEGMPATLTLSALPDGEFKGKVLFVDPLLDPKARTVKVRLAFANPRGELRPEMFGEVVLHRKAREALRLPKDAVVDSGTERFVFLALGNGKFQPRAVRLGEASGELAEVLAGVQEGDQVVTRANFLVDSESRLRASLAELSGGANPRGEAAPHDHGSHGSSPAHEEPTP